MAAVAELKCHIAPTGESAPAAITLHNLTVAYNRHPAIHHVSGVFREGSLTALCGPNGGSITGASLPVDGGWTAH